MARWPVIAFVAGAITTLGPSAVTVAQLPPATPTAEPMPAPAVPLAAQSSAERYRLLNERIFGPNPTPEADALAAAAQGEFSLLNSGNGMTLMTGPLAGPPFGIACHTPFGDGPQAFATHGLGDNIGPRDFAWADYAVIYNRTLVTHPAYPDADLCRPMVEGEHDIGHSALNLGVPARRTTGPAGSLHEAARRSDAAEVQHWLASTAVDALDIFGMTALGWATARDNRAAIEILLAAGADPWLGERTSGYSDPSDLPFSAVYLAALFGRADLFAALIASTDRPHAAWRSIYLAAALMGGSRPIIERILGEEHEALDWTQLPSPMPSAAAMEFALRDNPSLVEPLLMEAIYPERSRRGSVGEDPRPDLVALALAHGADPNLRLPDRSGTPLGLAVRTILPGPAGIASVVVVRTLLQAGADPNLLPGWTPLVISAVGRVGARYGEVSRFAEEIFAMLMAAGADINLRDSLGRPGIWSLLFPWHSSPMDLYARDITPEAIELLVHNGLDLNAEYEGRRVLQEVEAQAGPDSELAATLRRLGAV